MAEDWDSIRSLVQQSGMPLEHAVTDIISTVDLTKGRERVLMDLAGGTPYRYLQDRIFPRVRRVEYAISYSQHRLDTAEGRRLFELGSRSLKLSEFFNVAMSYPKGSNEYNDALDLAARLFPDSPEAAINAAGVALSKHDLKKAHAYLDRYATLPAAYNNMGILYLLEGNRDKAEVYLQMAAAAGVSEAKKALGLEKNSK
jgi:tetratricopeptide (TPR) repeat protein